MLQRNREVRRVCLGCIALSIIAAAITYLIVLMHLDDITNALLEASDPIGRSSSALSVIAPALSSSKAVPTTRSAALAAAACTLLSGLALTALFLLFTRQRYRALARMAANLDRVLAGERDIDFRDMNEGELAILSSEIDKVIARLNLTVDELQREKLALSDSLADISHQLKTPLTSIALSTELIRDKLAERGGNPELVERLRLIQRLQERVEGLVAALLKLARIDAGVIKLVSMSVDAARLVRRAFEPLAVAFDINDVRLEVDIEDGAGFEGDLSWSAEALENILKNCMEHTPAGGTVRVSAAEDVLACRIRIEDTGPGIAEEDLPHIFERFYRGSAQRDTPSEVNPTGVGIGLALAKSLVAAQGGTLTAENRRDAEGNVTGAAFTMVFFKAVV